MKVWIHKGEVAEHQTAADEAWPGATVGQTEYQFSDGPGDGRGSSADYIDLRKGLEEHRGYEFNLTEEEWTDGERAILAEFGL